MAWNLEGSYAETCSCELMCPCNLTFDHGATYDFCRATLAFDIREGEIDGTDVRGRRVVTIIDTPKVMTDGNWRLGMFVDDRATDEQFDKLVKVFGGQLGGPMAALAPSWVRSSGSSGRPSRSTTMGCDTASASETRSSSRSRTSSPSGSRQVGRFGSTACSIRRGRT